MSFFRLVLCLAGLAIYFLARQVVNAPPPRPMEPAPAVPPIALHARELALPSSSTNDSSLPPSSELVARKSK
jgi:hypothetical protein